MSVIGLDVGTTGCKAIAFDEAGRILSRASREYPVSIPHPQWAEQDAEQVWALAWSALREAVAAVPGDPPIALALSVQGEAIIPVNGAGRALRPAILGMDTRTGQEVSWLAERWGAEELFCRTGMPMHTVNTLPKLIWLQCHENEAYRVADQFLLYEDFLLRRLGGQASISHCLASRTQMYDLGAGEWAADLLEGCGIDGIKMAPLAPEEGGVVGALRADLQRELGLQRPLLLVSGGHDQACAALGSGVVRAGRAMVSTGTAEVVEVAMDSPALDDRLRRANISIYRHVVRGLYLAMTLNHSGGLLLRWFRDALCRWEREQARDPASEQHGRDPYDLILEGTPEGPTGLMVLPHFSGSGTPWFDTESKGAILGLTFAATRASIAKAILEGLTFELRINLDLLRDAGIEIEELNAVGGGARSPLWVQLKADICRAPLQVPDVTESACLGAAMLAGVAAGVWPSLDAAAAQRACSARRVEPDPGRAAAYQERYAIYRQVYPALRALNPLL